MHFDIFFNLLQCKCHLYDVMCYMFCYMYAVDIPFPATAKDSFIASKQPQRVYRAEKTYAAGSGKWYVLI